ncbi:MAG TPA: hypothetical protein VIZ65_05300 [Cellvibrionaceae bacterium]
MSTMSELIGSQLLAYEIEAGNAGFQFSVGSLSVYNLIDILGELESLVGSKVTSVIFTKEGNLEIEFSSNSRLIVSLNPNHYTSPEAFCMRFKTGVVVVE